MNNKSEWLLRVVDTVVDCCSMEVDSSGRRNMTRDDVLGKSRSENIVMTRCIVAMLIVGEGYSVSTVAMLMNRTSHAVRKMIESGHQYQMTSRAFRIANAEATLAVKAMGENMSIPQRGL